jgi:hypothetical protein
MQFVAKYGHVRGRLITISTSSTLIEEFAMTRLSTTSRRRLLLAAGALALAAPLAASAYSFGGDTVHGNGKTTRQVRQVPAFTGVEMAVPGKVELHVGSGDGLTIETDDNVMPLVETRVENGVLRIRPVRDNLNLDPRSLRITVNARVIERLSVGGSGTIDADALRGRRLELNVGGSGAINAHSIEGDELSVDLGGSGNVTGGGGAVGKLRVSLAGSGEVKLGKVKAGAVHVNTAGSGETTVWAANKLDVSLVGSGGVQYYGDPQVSRSVIGSADVHRAGAAPR